MKTIKLSTGKLCPRCGCDSLEEYSTTRRHCSYYFDKTYHCVAECGMDFGLSKMQNNKIKIGYDKENETYLKKRFNF